MAHSRSARSEIRHFELSFDHKHKEQALNSYFAILLKETKEKEQETITLKIFTLDLDLTVMHGRIPGSQ